MIIFYFTIVLSELSIKILIIPVNGLRKTNGQTTATENTRAARLR